MITDNILKKNLIEKLYKESKITLEELILLIEKDPEYIYSYTPGTVVFPSPVYPYPTYPDPNYNPYVGKTICYNTDYLQTL